MVDRLKRFESIVRIAHGFSDREAVDPSSLHAFEQREIYAKFPPKVRKLFDDGHYTQATFEAFKFIDKFVQKHSKMGESGYKLMMAAFDKAKPNWIKLTPAFSASEIDEQEGFRFMFAGAMTGIRNPRGHEFTIHDDIDTCLDHLGFASMLMRRLEAAGYS